MPQNIGNLNPDGKITVLKAIIFAEAGEPQSRIQRRCITSENIDLYASPNYRPSGPDIVRLVNSYLPELVFIEFFNYEDAINITNTVRASCPNVAILGIADQWPREQVIRTDSGVVKLVHSSIALEDFKHRVADAVSGTKAIGRDNVLVFLPAKAGSGASSVALNVTASLAGCGKSAILIETDLHSGPAGMYLDLNAKCSVLDAVNESRDLQSRWDYLVTNIEGFSVLPAGNIHGTVPQVSPWAYQRIISYARSQYEHVVCDLPEVVNPATKAIVTIAKTVYVVCTPETPSLALAKKRTAALLDVGVPATRMQLVLNRHTKGDLDADAIAEIIGVPVAYTIPNDYPSFREAMQKRTTLAANSKVGRAVTGFAMSLGIPENAQSGRRGFQFLRLFSAA